MSSYTVFEGRIEPLVWGDKTYTILRLPSECAQTLGSAKRLEGEINGYPVNLAPSRAPVLDGPFLWTGASLIHELGVTPGEPLDVRLRPADPDAVETPPDVAAALRERALTDIWEALTPGKRRGLLYQVNTAKKAETRARRIAKLIEALADG